MNVAATLRMLAIEDNPGDARLLREILLSDGTPLADLILAESMADAEAYLASHRVDVVLLDLGLPDAHGLEAVRRAKAAARGAALVILTGRDDDDLAILALRHGAQDYLIKSQLETRGLERALRYAMERKATVDAATAEHEHAQIALSSIRDAVVGIDTDGRITFINPAAAAMSGWAQREAVGMAMLSVLRLVSATSREAMFTEADLAHPTARTVDTTARCVLVTRAGIDLPVTFSISPACNEAGSIVGAVIVLNDATDAQAQASQMAHAAHHDFLTGLPNRMLLRDRIAQAIAAAARRGKLSALLFLDLDGFKQINDTLGHLVGDRLLQSVARRITDCVRETDTVSRQGGDEFIVLLSDIERGEKAADVAKRIVQAISATHSIEQHELKGQVSIGISIYPQDGSDAETLIRHADIAMYQAKRNRQQRWRFFEPEMNLRATRRLTLEETLLGAVERRELAVTYQPRVSLLTGRVCTAEAVLTWIHPASTAIGENELISIAERCGMMPIIGPWMLGQVCRQARMWLNAGVPASVMAVTVSPLQFRHANFLTGVFDLLAENDLDPGMLELGLPEEVLMKRAEATVGTLRSLRDRGVRIALDNFGGGFSSLTHLRTFPIDVLKMDPSFVRQIGQRPEDAAIVGAVIKIAHSLKLLVVANGVETPEERRFLEANACTEAQGRYFGEPGSALEVARLLEGVSAT